MIIVFVGPSLPDASDYARPGIEIRPPAVQGDILAAVEDGAAAIGLIDGGFEYAPSVWHKEILYALSGNVRVYGASSMGALRAAECHAFGMTGVGAIYQRYASGEYVDDSDVALLHAPAELGYGPLTVPMVNVDATLRRIQAVNVLSPKQCASIATAARHIFYKKRNWSAVAKAAPGMGDLDKTELLDLLKFHAVDQKQQDARTLFDELLAAPDGNDSSKYHWKFLETSIWRQMRNQRER